MFIGSIDRQNNAGKLISLKGVVRTRDERAVDMLKVIAKKDWNLSEQIPG
jgi:hypothetical protein